MRIVAFDLSLSATGWCTVASTVGWGVFNPPNLRDIERIDWIAMRCALLVAGTSNLTMADLVVMEDFAFASNMQGARENYDWTHASWRVEAQLRPVSGSPVPGTSQNRRRSGHRINKLVQGKNNLHKMSPLTDYSGLRDAIDRKRDMLDGRVTGSHSQTAGTE